MSVHSALPGRLVKDADEHTCTLWHIKRRLGAAMSDRRMCAYVTQLIEKKGFPQPLPALKLGRLVEHVIPNSRWMRTGVDVWFDNYLPPEAHVALDNAARAEAADAMDEAARGLGLRLVGGSEA